MNRLTAPDIRGFTFVDHIGSGGFAEVFLYEQKLPARKVAVKVLNQLHDSEAGLEEFYAEANVMAQLSGHPSVVGIFAADVGDDGRPYIVMEYCPPPSLAGRFRKERIAVSEVLDIGIRIAGAVETAHRVGILHRDIKPHNILASASGAPKLTDFGIAGSMGEDGASYGMSIPWSPPESFGEEPSGDVRSDVYSLAATIYTLLAGRSPFEIPGGANDNIMLMTRIERSPLGRINRPDVPDALENVLARALSKQADARPPSALDFAKELQHLQATLGLPQTNIEVFDSSGESAAPEAQDQHTHIRPVKIVVPDVIADRGTMLRPKVVQAQDDRTQQRRRPAEETVLRPTTDRSAAVAPSEGPPVEPLPGPAFESQSPSLIETVRLPEETRSHPKWVMALVGALGLVLIAGVAGVLVFGKPDPDTSNTVENSNEQPNSAVVGTHVAAVTKPVAKSNNGSVTWSWKHSEAESGDSFGVQYSVANGPVQTEVTRNTNYTVNARSGEIVCLKIAVIRANGTSSDLTDGGCEVTK